jgi:glycosyltransferase involved in cell wall biosynthesis
MSFITFVPLTARRILEVACGDSSLARHYRRRNPTAEYVGFESAGDGAAVAAAHVDRMVVGELEELDTKLADDGVQFDLAVVPNILLQKYPALVSRLTTLVCDGGYVFARPPNVAHWMTYAGVRSLRPPQFQLNPAEIPLSSLETQSTEVALAQGGFAVRRTYPLEFSPAGDDGWPRAFSALAQDLGVDREALLQRAAASFHAVCAQKPGSRRPTGRALRIHVAVLAPAAMDIRTILPATALRSDPELSVSHGEAPLYLPALAPEAPKVLVIQRPRYDEIDSWRESLAKCLNRGWVLVLEFDDHPHAAAETVGAIPTELDWTKFGYYHAVQTSTEPLRDAFLRYNPEVKVFRNAVFDLPPFPQQNRGSRVFYGAIGRGDFPVRIAASLAATIRDFPDVEFVVVGDPAVFKALPTAKKRYYEVLPYAKYLDMMASCEISLAPLEGRKFEYCKSDAKFLDAARGGVLTIASPTVYADVIVHGANGLIAQHEGDWAKLLSMALADPAGRVGMARRAWEYVREERMFACQMADRREWYMDLWARRDALSEQLIARMPGLAEELRKSRQQA